MNTCHWCKTPLQITCYAMNRKESTPLRCTRCGAVHAHLAGETTVISPRMMPMGLGAKASPWMLPKTRPIEVGVYECRFRDVENPLPLWWNGGNFQVSDTDARSVQMGTFLTWRGEWQ